MDATTTQALADLREIPLPAPISYRPATVGWVVVGVLVLAAAAYAAWRWWRRWQANRYRREALRAMDDLERRLARVDTRAAAIAELPALLKRTALARFPRARVAPLTDTEWLAFLDHTCPPGGFVAGPGRWLPRLAYATGGEPPLPDLRDLLALVRRWIRYHDARV
jgi:hypothetical protein